MRAPRSPGSLRSRLSWTATLVVAAWALALAVGAYVLLGAALTSEADEVLRARAQSVAATVTVDAGGRVEVVEGGGDDSALDVGTWVLAPDGTVVESPSGDTDGLDTVATDLAARATGTGGEVLEDSGVVEPVRLLALPVAETSGPSGAAVVVTSTSLAPYEQLRETALAGVVVGVLLLVLVVHLVLRATVRRALVPVQDMTSQAGRWSADDVTRRFGPGPRPTELADLAAVLDGVLDRLGAVLRHEQAFTAEVSHELRTPLARVRTQVDWLRSHPRGAQETAEGLAAVDDAAADLEQTLTTLLEVARTSSTTTAPGRCAVHPLLRELAVTAPRERVDVVALTDQAREADLGAGADLVVGTDAAVLRRLLAPLLDNALRYAATRVELSAHTGAGGVVIGVDDDGPGVPDHLLEDVFAPGTRADPADGHDGAGLGLALARRLARAAGGDVVGEPAPGGHLRVLLPPG